MSNQLFLYFSLSESLGGFIFKCLDLAKHDVRVPGVVAKLTDGLC